VHQDNFEDNTEARQLFYVSLSRARHQLLVRIASSAVPPVCEQLGLAGRGQFEAVS
jgi:superfamily I DNA/RNA helicase